MFTASRFKRLFAFTAALALTASIGLTTIGQAENAEKHFSIVEAAADQNALQTGQAGLPCEFPAVLGTHDDRRSGRERLDRRKEIYKQQTQCKTDPDANICIGDGYL